MGNDHSHHSSGGFIAIHLNDFEVFQSGPKWWTNRWTDITIKRLTRLKKKKEKKKWFHSTIIWINSHEDGRIFFVINVLLVSLKILLTHWWSTGIPQVHSHSTGMRDQNSNTHTNTTHMHYLSHTHTHKLTCPHILYDGLLTCFLLLVFSSLSWNAHIIMVSWSGVSRRYIHLSAEQ